MGTVVIDIGCATYGESESLSRLAEQWKPDVIYGFDPHHTVTSGLSTVEGVPVVTWRAAAWIRNGDIGFQEAETGSNVDDLHSDRVPCIDLAEFVAGVKQVHPRSKIVLKIDAEGAEYPLLAHLIAADVDQHIHELMIEWHDPDSPRQHLENTLRCPIGAWVW